MNIIHENTFMNKVEFSKALSEYFHVSDIKYGVSYGTMNYIYALLTIPIFVK